MSHRKSVALPVKRLFLPRTFQYAGGTSISCECFSIRTIDKCGLPKPFNTEITQIARGGKPVLAKDFSEPYVRFLRAYREKPERLKLSLLWGA